MRLLLMFMFFGLTLTGCSALPMMQQAQGSDEAKATCLASTLAMECLAQTQGDPRLADPKAKRAFQDVQAGVMLTNSLSCRLAEDVPAPPAQ